MRLAAALALIAAGCGGKAGAGARTIDNAGTSQDGALRPDPAAPLRDCPPGVLAKLAPGWTDDSELDDWETVQLDLCLRGNLLGDSILVYTSAPAPADSQTEDPWPGRRVIVSLDGAPLLELPGTGGSYMSSPPSLAALVDLDGDGTHEILEDDEYEVMVPMLRVHRLAGRELVEVGAIITGAGFPDDGWSCAATWSVAPPDATGHRALIVTVTEVGDFSEDDYPMGSDPALCPDAGVHHYHLDSGALVEESDGDLEDSAP